MKPRLSRLLGVGLLAVSGIACARPDDVTLSAATLRAGCTVVLHPQPIDEPGTGGAFDMQLLWQCRSGAPVSIGTIGAEGGGPEIVTVFYRPDEIVTLARWESSSPVADFQGEFYEVDAFRLVQHGGATAFVPVPAIRRAFGDGEDGTRGNTRRVFRYKTAAAIRARLAALGL